jgi:hypothetical protein
VYVPIEQVQIETTGTARLVEIGPCPELESDPGTLVIGRYRHELVDASYVSTFRNWKG